MQSQPKSRDISYRSIIKEKKGVLLMHTKGSRQPKQSEAKIKTGSAGGIFIPNLNLYYKAIVNKNMILSQNRQE